MATRGFTQAFERFAKWERAGGVLLIAATVIAFTIANSSWGASWLAFWQRPLLGLTLQHWVNDALMAVFFLVIGLELEREIYVGELSDLRAAMLPIAAAIGGMAVPAAIHFALNAGTPAQPGAGIPMATDIAFALAALAVLGSRLPASLKVFLTALAVIDDLGAIVIIGLAYTADLKGAYLVGAIAVFAALVVLNRRHVTALAPYFAGGALMWFLMLRSGVHPTLAGVLLAFAIPFGTRGASGESASERLEHVLHRPVSLLVLPLFALANAGVVVPDAWHAQLLGPNAIGIMAGLVLGKPVGIVLACFIAVRLGLVKLPPELGWGQIAGAGLLAGIGFTMSIFIANLAFANDAAQVDASKMAILLASIVAATAGIAWLAVASRTRGARP